MLSEDTKILQFNQHQISNKTPFPTYADLESLIEKIHGCKNNPEKSSTTKAGEYIPSVFQWQQNHHLKTENNHGVNRGKDCMKKFCESLREPAVEIINFKKEKMKLLTNEQWESYENAKICYICKERLEDKYVR